MACSSQAVPVPPAPTPDSALVLIQVQDRDGYATGNVLMDGGPMVATVAAAFVPSSLLVPIGQPPQVRSITLGATPDDPDTMTPAVATQDVLDVTIEGSWTLDLLAFAGLIDAVGGVVVDVPDAVVIPGDGNSPDTFITSGRQRLGGIIGAEYATSTFPAEDPYLQLQRFQDVWTAVVARLPDSPERLRQILTSLGFLARTTVSIETLLMVLESARSSIAEDRLTEDVVDVDVIRGGDRPASIITRKGSRTVATMFPEFVQPPSDRVQAQ